MREVIAVPFAEVAPAFPDVLPRLGMPADIEVPSHIRLLLAEASARLAAVAEPVGVIAPVDAETFAAIYRGEGRNAPDTPLDAIVPRADALALFVVTLGSRVDQEIASLFRAGDPALGSAVDAFASSAANSAVELLGSRFLASVRSARGFGESVRVLPYSPGYCGWHVSGQRSLFEAVVPTDIRVILGASYLMTPIKSVSGVFVAGDAAVHRFRLEFDFCNECTTQECVPRMRSTR